MLLVLSLRVIVHGKLLISCFSYKIYMICLIILKFVLEGLHHCITEPVRTEGNKLLADHDIMLSRSMTENRGSPRQDLMLDRLSEREKVVGHVTTCTCC